MPHPRLPNALWLALTLTGCVQFPELDATVDPAVASQPFPAIVPLAPILAEANIPATAPTELDAKAAALRARATALRALPCPPCT